MWCCVVGWGRGPEENLDHRAAPIGPTQGRWWTPGPAGMAAADPRNRQSWNRYAYVGGTPLAATDRLGLDGDCATETQEQAIRDGCCSITVTGSDGDSTVFDFSDVGYLYCALMGCSGGPPQLLVDGVCMYYGCSSQPGPTEPAEDSGSGLGGVVLRVVAGPGIAGAGDLVVDRQRPRAAVGVPAEHAGEVGTHWGQISGWISSTF